MIITSGVTSRLATYDRNSFVRSSHYHAFGVAPHASTIRSTYTVPDSKKAKLIQAIAFMERITASGGSSENIMIIEYTPSGGAATDLRFRDMYNNIVGGIDEIKIISELILTAGDLITISTVDNSASGTFNIETALILNEFNA